MPLNSDCQITSGSERMQNSKGTMKNNFTSGHKRNSRNIDFKKL